MPLKDFHKKIAAELNKENNPLNNLAALALSATIPLNLLKKNREVASYWGCAVFFIHNTQCYLLSAAHVIMNIDLNEYDGPFLLGLGEVIKVAGKIITTRAGRDDKYDIAAPYDGGIDFILKDVSSKDIYKEKYRHWLSEREDGL